MALFELKQDTGSGAAAPWAPPTFKDCVAADIDAAFFEENEHADRHTVDGKDVNVLDPAKHTADIDETTVQVNSGVAVLDVVGVLLDKLTVKSGSTALTRDTDYTASFEQAVQFNTLYSSAVEKLHRTAEADTGSADIGEEETQCEPIST